MAWVANRSITVRNAVSPMMKVRRTTCSPPCAGTCVPFIACDICDMADLIVLDIDLFGSLQHLGRRLVKDHAFQRVDFALPGRLLKSPRRLGVACFPALADAGRAEVDILGV